MTGSAQPLARPSAPAPVVVFALVGPAVGVIPPTLLMLFDAARRFSSTSGDLLDGLVGFLVFALLFAYVIGFIPAVVTGLVARRIRPRLSRVGYLSACTALGTVCGGLPGLLLLLGPGGARSAAVDAAKLVALLACSGALAGLVCAWISRSRRVELAPA